MIKQLKKINMGLLLIFIFFVIICWVTYKPNIEKNSNGDWMLFYWGYNERKWKYIWKMKEN